MTDEFKVYRQIHILILSFKSLSLFLLISIFSLAKIEFSCCCHPMLLLAHPTDFIIYIFNPVSLACYSIVFSHRSNRIFPAACKRQREKNDDDDEHRTRKYVLFPFVSRFFVLKNKCFLANGTMFRKFSENQY